jgi:hypothetical protein
MSSQFQLPGLPNDMPPELRDKLILQAKIDYIFKTGGIVDLTQIENTITALKNQLNSLISQVLGLEHTIDGIHTYDDTSLKSQLATSLTMAQNAQAQVNVMEGRVGLLEGTTAEATGDIQVLETKTASITTPNGPGSVDITAGNSLELFTLAQGGFGSNIELLVGSMMIIHHGETADGGMNNSQITLGGGTDGGISVGSDNKIDIANHTYPAKGITIGTDGEVSIGGTKIVISGAGIDFVGSGTNANKHVQLTWTAV